MSFKTCLNFRSNATVVSWLSFKAVENRDVFARAYKEVFTMTVRTDHKVFSEWNEPGSCIRQEANILLYIIYIMRNYIYEGFPSLDASPTWI